jgi:CheY-like chemotaxis protein
VVNATVAQIRMGGGPGSPAGYVCEFEITDDAMRRRTAEISQRLRPTAGALANRELSILLVEDNQLLRDTFAYAFERYFRTRTAGVKLWQASTAEEAWSLAKPETDLLLVDHVLKGEAGTSFVSRVRSDARLGRTFIVGMSGGGPSARKAMLDAGCDLFLSKPIVLKDLFTTLEFLTGSPSSWREYGAA